MKALASLEANEFAAREAALQSAEVSEGVRPSQQAADIPMGYEPPAIDEHRANFERIKTQRPPLGHELRCNRRRLGSVDLQIRSAALGQAGMMLAQIGAAAL